MIKIDPLDFDSALFGYPVGKADIEFSSSEKEILEASKSFQLVYLFSGAPLDFQSKQIIPTGETVQFSKSLEGSSEEQKEVSVLAQSPTKDHLSLAFQSGKFSRFKTDQRLTNGEFEKLYSIWLHKEYQEGKVFLINENQGLISVSGSGNNAQIGLFAVDKKFRGQGLGRKLLEHLEFQLSQKGIKKLTVKTQRANSVAVNFYVKNGFREVGSRFVCHFWDRE
ncbi:GNAT family N-acetyltransferase [Algoriphagus sediminis]|uniref:GNAT family N-acetyltransferase n=1 Tax=Algoriphagus sediminis TaxID=3057113 RepID=A0ABT7YDU8_9BACT|nr:GNAT family N-acetyltransferase [Algoriphagus sediminis]MDN3204711.1 GNAT family N-acetyltransferase [Algoriphagus sediminis]